MSLVSKKVTDLSALISLCKTNFPPLLEMFVRKLMPQGNHWKSLIQSDNSIFFQSLSFFIKNTYPKKTIILIVQINKHFWDSLLLSFCSSFPGSPFPVQGYLHSLCIVICLKSDRQNSRAFGSSGRISCIEEI